MLGIVEKVAEKTTQVVTTITETVVETTKGAATDAGGAPPPPTPDEVKDWADDTVQQVASDATVIIGGLNRLKEFAPNEQVGNLMFLRAVVAEVTNPGALSKVVNFLIRKRFQSNRGLLKALEEFNPGEEDWLPLIKSLAERRGNLDELLEAIERSDNVEPLVRVLLKTDSSEAFRMRVLRYASRLTRVFEAVVAVLREPPHSVPEAALILDVLQQRSSRLRTRTLRRLLEVLDARGWLDQREVIAYLSRRRESLVGAFLKALRDAGIRIVRKHVVDPARRSAEWIAGFQTRLASPSERQAAEIELCATRLMIEAIVASASPDRNDELQVRVAERLAAEIPTADLQRVRDFFTPLKTLIDGSGLTPRANNTDELGQMMISPGAPLSSLAQAASPDRAESDPWDMVEILTPHTEGIPYPAGGWDPGCLERFRRGELSASIREEIEQYYGTDELYVGGKRVLPQAHVDEVIIYDRSLRQTVRTATTADKKLVIEGFDPRNSGGWDKREVEMAVEVDDERCLINKKDDSDGKQILAVDVSPAFTVPDDAAPGGSRDEFLNTVRVIGTGFLSEEVEVIAQRVEWDDPEGDSQGRLVPKTRPVATGLPAKLKAFNSPVFDDASRNIRKHEILFNWPASAAVAGLYKVTFRFKNETGLKALSRSQPKQDPTTCALGLTDTVETQPLWFAVLSPPLEWNVEPTVSRVECVELTNPPTWFDDMNLSATVERQQVGIKYEAELKPDGTAVAPVAITDGGNFRFDQFHRVWPARTNLLAAAGAQRHRLELNQVMSFALELLEMDEEEDRRWVTLIVQVCFIVIGVMVTLLWAGFMLFVGSWVVVLGLAFSSVSKGATVVAAITAIPPLIGVFLTGVGVIWKVLYDVYDRLLPVILALINGSDRILGVGAQFSGAELAYTTSPVRFHRLLWLPSSAEDNSRVVEKSVSPSDVTVTFEDSNPTLGGKYRLQLKLAK